jgi:hypothetical protein
VIGEELDRVFARLRERAERRRHLEGREAPSS